MRKLILFVTTAALALAIAAPALAGGGGHGTARCPGFADGEEIVMLDNCFAGTAHFAPHGERLTIVNDGQFQHTYTAVDGSFDTGMLQPGDSYEIVMKGPGVFEVFCTLHGTASGDGMAGVLVAGGGALPATVPAVAPTPPAVQAQPLPSELVAALDRQSAAIAELTAQEAALLGRMATAEPEGWPPQLTAVLLVAALAVVGVLVAIRPADRAERPA